MEQSNLPENRTAQEVAKRIDIEAVKSIYYWLNAKPDTQIKIFKNPKLINFEDIISLNEQIQRKLINHDPQTMMVQVNVLLEDGEIKSFGTWDEFKATKWNTISTETESISIVWDMNIKLPHYEMPQRHTMKVRLGSPIRPNEFFQMMVTSDDDSEIKQSIAPVICKVDFINSVISNELIQIVDNWYKCLKNTEPRSLFQKFISHFNQQVSRITHYLVIIAGLFIAFYFFKLKISSITNFQLDKELLISGYYWIIITLATYFVANFIGGLIGQLVFKTIGKIEDLPLFDFTKGDKNEIDRVLSNNRKATRNFIIQIFLTAGGALLSVLMDRII